MYKKHPKMKVYPKKLGEDGFVVRKATGDIGLAITHLGEDGEYDFILEGAYLIY